MNKFEPEWVVRPTSTTGGAAIVDKTTDSVKWEIVEEYHRKPYKVGKRWHCGQCSTAIGRFWNYCQKCGVRIDWNGVER